MHPSGILRSAREFNESTAAHRLPGSQFMRNLYLAAVHSLFTAGIFLPSVPAWIIIFFAPLSSNKSRLFLNHTPSQERGCTMYHCCRWWSSGRKLRRLGGCEGTGWAKLQFCDFGKSSERKLCWPRRVDFHFCLYQACTIAHQGYNFLPLGFFVVFFF